MSEDLKKLRPDAMSIFSPDLSRFKGELAVLVQRYIDDERLRSQSEIDIFADILVEAQNYGDNWRYYIMRQTVARIGRQLDLYNDPEYYDLPGKYTYDYLHSVT